MEWSAGRAKPYFGVPASTNARPTDHRSSADRDVPASTHGRSRSGRTIAAILRPIRRALTAWRSTRAAAGRRAGGRRDRGRDRSSSAILEQRDRDPRCLGRLPRRRRGRRLGRRDRAGARHGRRSPSSSTTSCSPSPRFSLVVSDPNELLNLVLVLFVALVVGRLAALGRERADRSGPTRSRGDRAVRGQPAAGDRRPTEAVGRRDRRAGSPARPGLDRVWIGLDGGRARTGPRRHRAPAAVPAAAIVTTLVRTPGDEPARWVRAHEPAPASRAGRDRAGRVLRVRIETEGTHVRVALGRHAGRASGRPDPKRRGSCRSPPTRSRSGCGATGCARRRPAPRSPAGATRSRARCSIRSRTTCARRSPASGRPPATSPTRRSTGRREDTRRGRRVDRRRGAPARPPRPLRPRPQPDRIRGPACPTSRSTMSAELVEQAVRRARPALDPRPRHDRASPRTLPLIRRSTRSCSTRSSSNVLDNVADHTPPDDAGRDRRPTRRPGPRRAHHRGRRPGRRRRRPAARVRQVPARRPAPARARATGWASACRSSAA